MKSSFRSPRSAYLKSIFWIAQLALCFGGPTVAKAGQRDSSTGPIQPELNDQAELPQGYLLVYRLQIDSMTEARSITPTAPTPSTRPTESSLRM